ncbi:hypothetical protein AMTR_s00043p00222460, partial [Amborella trichopoda]
TTTSQHTQKRGFSYSGHAGLPPWPFFTDQISHVMIAQEPSLSPVEPIPKEVIPLKSQEEVGVV